MEKYRLFSDDELEILSWSLDDHAVKVLTIAKEHGLSNARPNLAYLDTMILKNEVDAEMTARRHKAVRDKS